MRVNAQHSAGKYDTTRNLESAVKCRQMASPCAHVLCHAWLAGQRWGAVSVKKRRAEEEESAEEKRGKVVLPSG